MQIVYAGIDLRRDGELFYFAYTRAYTRKKNNNTDYTYILFNEMYIF